MISFVKIGLLQFKLLADTGINLIIINLVFSVICMMFDIVKAKMKKKLLKAFIIPFFRKNFITKIFIRIRIQQMRLY